MGKVIEIVSHGIFCGLCYGTRVEIADNVLFGG